MFRNNMEVEDSDLALTVPRTSTDSYPGEASRTRSKSSRMLFKHLQSNCDSGGLDFGRLPCLLWYHDFFETTESEWDVTQLPRART